MPATYTPDPEKIGIDNMTRLIYYHLHPNRGSVDENTAVKELSRAMMPGEGEEPPSIPISTEHLRLVDENELHNIMAQPPIVRGNVYQHEAEAARIVGRPPRPGGGGGGRKRRSTRKSRGRRAKKRTRSHRRRTRKTRQVSKARRRKRGRQTRRR